MLSHKDSGFSQNLLTNLFMHLLEGQWILLIIIKFNRQSAQITKVIYMINDHWKANDLLININSYWS